MKKTIGRVGLLAAALALAGCGMPGHWVLHRVEPESALGGFRLTEITLRGDHTYAAECVAGGERATRNGRWRYDKGRLLFYGDDGRQRAYRAQLIEMERKLRVTAQVSGSDVVAIMKRGD